MPPEARVFLMGQVVSFVIPDFIPTSEVIGKIILEMINANFEEHQIDNILYIIEREHKKSRDEKPSNP